MPRLLLLLVLTLVASHAHSTDRLSLPLDFCNPDSATAESPESPCIFTGGAIFSKDSDELARDAALQALLREFAGEPWTTQGHPPDIGLAVSGGGSKSAPFAMGVIKRFADQDWLPRTDLLSSVSGGGYAAYFLYSRAWMRDAHPELVREQRTYSVKEPIVPRIKDFFADIRTEANCEHCDEASVRNDLYTPDVHRYGLLGDDPPSCLRFPVDTSRHQHYVACYQDVLSKHPGGSSTNITPKPWGAYISGALQTVATLPVHHFANTLFDWKVAVSPTRRMYRVGVGRTYGTLPRLDIDAEDLQAGENFTFEGLRAVYDADCPAGCDPVPWWIINTTNDVAGSEDKTVLSKTVFEITPTSFGSGTYGYVNGVGIDSLHSLTPLDTVAAAGAFFDSLSSWDPAGIPEWAVFGALHMANVRWGYELPNYRVANSARTMHRFLPWPFYYANPRFYRTPESNYIRIADGGMSGDNTGAFALLRRGTRHIVIADGDYDLNDARNASLSSLCTLSRTLGGIGYDIVFDGYPNDSDTTPSLGLAEICDSDLGQLHDDVDKRFSPYTWKKKVWTGTVLPLASTPPQRSRALLQGIRIYYIKAAIDYQELTDSRAAWAAKTICPQRSTTDTMLAINGEPCGMIGYLLDSDNFKDPARMQWPQTSTVRDTANSSANTYKAYRDLGWFLSGRLACIEDAPFANADVCRNAMGRSQQP